MEYKNQTENRAFQEMLQAAVKRLQNRSGEDLAAKSGAVFHSNRNMIEVPSLILSILVDTFISKISFPMQPGPEIGSISDA